jgi:hypothetical protein
MALTTANPLLLHYPAMSSKHSFFYCSVPFEVFMASTVTAGGKHATIYRRETVTIVLLHKRMDCTRISRRALELTFKG